MRVVASKCCSTAQQSWHTHATAGACSNPPTSCCNTLHILCMCQDNRLSFLPRLAPPPDRWLLDHTAITGNANPASAFLPPGHHALASRVNPPVSAAGHTGWRVHCNCDARCSSAAGDCQLQPPLPAHAPPAIPPYQCSSSFCCAVVTYLLPFMPQPHQQLGELLAVPRLLLHASSQQAPP